MARLFLAIWPDERTAATLAGLASELAARSGGKAVLREKVHLTAAFLGEVGDARWGDIGAAAAASARGSRPFGLCLDVVGSFREARVAWAGCRELPPGLAQLRTSLETELRGRDFALDARAYVAHVTLVRKAVRTIPGSAVSPIPWDAHELTLVRTLTGTGRYEVQARWALGS